VTFERFGALTADIALKGLIAGSSLMSGPFIAKRPVLRLEERVSGGQGGDHAGGRIGAETGIGCARMADATCGLLSS
jgi:hypothetical protein